MRRLTIVRWMASVCSRSPRQLLIDAEYGRSNEKRPQVCYRLGTRFPEASEICIVCDRLPAEGDEGTADHSDQTAVRRQRAAASRVVRPVLLRSLRRRRGTGPGTDQTEELLGATKRARRIVGGIISQGPAVFGAVCLSAPWLFHGYGRAAPSHYSHSSASFPASCKIQAARCGDACLAPPHQLLHAARRCGRTALPCRRSAGWRRRVCE